MICLAGWQPDPQEEDTRVAGTMRIGALSEQRPDSGHSGETVHLPEGNHRSSAAGAEQVLVTRTHACIFSLVITF
jgi:hypothetical protein